MSTRHPPSAGAGVKKLRGALLLALTATSACASPGAAPAPSAAVRPPGFVDRGTSMDVNFNPSRAVVSDEIAASADSVWHVLPQAYADLGIPVQEASDAQRVLGNARFVVSRRLAGQPLSRYLECGSGVTGPFADRYRIVMLIRTSVVPSESGGARVDTYLEATANNPEGSSNTSVACASTERLERQIFERVRLLTGGGK